MVSGDDEYLPRTNSVLVLVPVEVKCWEGAEDALSVSDVCSPFLTVGTQPRSSQLFAATYECAQRALGGAVHQRS
jgi:hypothetical protein